MTAYLPMLCAVCFGNPDSLLSKGAFYGVIFLLGVIVSVLVAIAWTAFVWARRSRRLSTSADAT